MPADAGLITRHLLDWRSGDPEALSRLTSAIYVELRRLAGAILRSGSQSESIRPTELVHELYLALPRVQEVDFEGRAHFFNLSARIMRRVLIDHARRRMAARRGGPPLTLRFDARMTDQAMTVDVLSINEALDRLAEEYPRQAQVVELRFFGGLTIEETVDAMQTSGDGISTRSVQRDWSFARAWLQNALTAR